MRVRRLLILAILVTTVGVTPASAQPSIQYSTYMGAAGDDTVPAVAVGSDGAGYIARATVQPGRGADVQVVKFDPVTHAVVFSTFVGGSSSDSPASIAIAPDDSVWVAGTTSSADFPSVNPLLTGPSGTFLFHLSPDGATVVFSTLIGTSPASTEQRVVADGGGGGAVVSSVECGTAIVTAGAFQPVPRGQCDGFVLRVSAAGAILAGTYLGGTGVEENVTVGLGQDGSVYLAGTTTSTDLATTTGAFQQTPGKRLQSCFIFTVTVPCKDGFVARLLPSLTALQYLTYLRETDAAGGQERIRAIAVGPFGDAYVTGSTTHSRFPTTPGAYRTTCVRCAPGGHSGEIEGDVFVTRISAGGTGLIYSTYLGGANEANPIAGGGQISFAIAIDGAGRAYVGGRTFSSEFPLLNAVRPGYAGVLNAFVSRFNDNGTLLDFSTTLGPGSSEQVNGLAVFGSTVWIGGTTRSAAFPTTPDALQPASGGSADGFVMALDVPGALRGTGPLLSIDIPLAGTVRLPFEIGGWAIDRGAASDSGIDAIHVYAFPKPNGAAIFLGAAPLGVSRPDVASAFGPQFADAGWLMEITSMPEGAYTLAAFAHSTITGRFDAVAQRSIAFPVPDPLMSIDAPAPSSVFPASSTVFIGGWAIDRSAVTGTGIDAIHVWIYPTPGDSAPPPFFAGVATYGVSRPDVGAAFGSRFTASGYELYVSGLAPGTYAAYVYAHSTVSNTFVISAAREFRIQ